MHVAVCIVAYRNPGDVGKCLAALEQQSHTDFAVIICENGGDVASRALAAILPAQLAGGQPVRLITAPDNPGYAGGVNRCLAASPDADAWWVLNPDTEPQPGALRALIDRLARGDVAAVGGLILAGDGRIGSCGGHWTPWLAFSSTIGKGLPVDAAPSEAEVEGKLSFVSGASLLCSRRFVETAGPMREDYFLYGEEVEWCLRARRAGLRLGYAPGASVVHHQGTATGSDRAVAERARLPVYFDERNRMLTLRDTMPLLLPVGALGALATLLYRYGRRRAWTQLGIALSAWRDGLLNRRGKPDWV